MNGICKYIDLIGTADPDYLKGSWKYYLQEVMETKDGKTPEI